jgi:acyl-CoA thioesterase FadM
MSAWATHVSPNFQTKLVTAKPEMNYRAPIPLDSIVLISVNVEKVEGRKAWVKATVEDPQGGKAFIKASAIFVEPKWAAGMSKVV